MLDGAPYYIERALLLGALLSAFSALWIYLLRWGEGGRVTIG